MWIMYHRGVQFVLHYLDDFLFAGPPGSSVCDTSLATAVSTCEALGFPIADNMHYISGHPSEHRTRHIVLTYRQARTYQKHGP